MTADRFEVAMAQIPDSVQNALVLVAPFCGLSMLPAEDDKPAYYSIVVRIGQYGCPLECEHYSFVEAAQKNHAHGDSVLLVRDHIGQRWRHYATGQFFRCGALDRAASGLAQKLECEALVLGGGP